MSVRVETKLPLARLRVRGTTAFKNTLHSRGWMLRENGTTSLGRITRSQVPQIAGEGCHFLGDRMKRDARSRKFDYELIKDEFVCEPGGKVMVKGKGELETWYLSEVKNPKP